MTRAVEDVLQEIAADEAPRAARAGQGRPHRRGAPRRAGPPPPRRAARLRGDAARASRRLIERIEVEFARRLFDVELLVPYEEGGRLAELHELAGDLEREDTPDGVRVSVRLPASVAARYADFALSPTANG